MVGDKRDYPALVGALREQMGLSQEDLARELGVSFGTINRWENGKVRPSKLAKGHLDAFIEKMIAEGKLKLPRKAIGTKGN